MRTRFKVCEGSWDAIVRAIDVQLGELGGVLLGRKFVRETRELFCATNIRSWRG
jgi:hypothetical protein